MIAFAKMTSEMPVLSTQNSPTTFDSIDQSKSLKQRLGNMSTFMKSLYMRALSKNVTIPTNDEAIECSASGSQQIQSLPDEMMVQIFQNLDRKSLNNSRAVSSRWNNVILRNMRFSQEPITVSRLTITYIEESRNYKLSWCKYTASENKCHELFVSQNDLTSTYSLGFCFSQLEIQRLIIENMPKNAFNDRFVQFLCKLFQNCRDFKPLQLSIKNVDLSKLSSDGLKKLLTICAKRLEILEFYGIGNVASDLITDEHLSILEPNRVRRLSIQLKDPHNETSFDSLQVGDESLQAFIRLQLFPSFTMGHCLVTSTAVIDYVKEWLLLADREDSMKSHTINLTNCPNVTDEDLELAFEQQELNVIKRMDEEVNKFPFDLSGQEGKRVTYTVRLNKEHQEFNINVFTTSH